MVFIYLQLAVAAIIFTLARTNSIKRKQLGLDHDHAFEEKLIEPKPIWNSVQQCQSSQGPKDDGEEWTDGDFVKQCVVQRGAWFTKITACIWDKNKLLIPRGTSKKVGSLKAECKANGTSTSFQIKLDIVLAQTGNGSGSGLRPRTKVSILTTASPNIADLDSTNGNEVSFGPDPGPIQCNTSHGQKDEGEEWIDAKFVKRCVVQNGVWKTKDIACIYHLNRIHKLIPLGTTKTVGNVNVECKAEGDRAFTIALLNDPAFLAPGPKPVAVQCETRNGLMDAGEEWMDGNFLKQCVVKDFGWETKIVACMWNEKNLHIPRGETKRIGNLKAECKANGISTRFQVRPVHDPSAAEVKCDSNKGPKRNGDEWVERRFAKRCVVSSDGWTIKTLACLWEQKDEFVRIPVDDSRVVGNLKAECTSTNNGRSTRFKVTPVYNAVKPAFPSRLPNALSKCKSRSGGLKTNGQQWIEANFLKTCTIKRNGWAISILACVWEEFNNLKIAVGESHEMGDQRATCLNDGKTTKFQIRQTRRKYQRKYHILRI